MDWVQWLALVGGLTAAIAFAAGRRDVARSQAAAIYVLVPLFQAAPAPPGRSPFTRYKIINDGDLPALSVAVSAWGWGRRRWTWRLWPHEGWMTGSRIMGSVYPSIAPHSETTEDEFFGVDKPGPPDERPPLMLIFRDGYGRRWVRWPDGKLTRLGPSLYALGR